MRGFRIQISLVLSIHKTPLGVSESDFLFVLVAGGLGK